MTMRTLLSKLRRERRGVTVVEFAIILPGMLTLICGSIEVGHMVFARVVLEGAVTEAARKATASMETDEATRTTIMRNSILTSMSDFPTATGQSVTITTKVYHDFNSVTPETYTDTNANGRYDLGEPYVDRNKNGVWNDAAPIAGSTLGGPGDVVSYTVQFPKRVLFGFLGIAIARNGAIPMSATTVVRNEAVKQKSAT